MTKDQVKKALQTAMTHGGGEPMTDVLLKCFRAIGHYETELILKEIKQEAARKK